MKKLLIVLFFFQFAAFAQTNTEKFHRAKINYLTLEKFQELEKAGVAMDHGIHKKGYSLTSDFSDTEIQIAKNLGLEVDIEIEDVQQFYVSQNLTEKSKIASPENSGCSNNIIDYQTPFNFQPGSMGGYFTYAEMLQALDNMRSLRPDLISSRANVGSFLTSEGRALQWVKITKNPESVNVRPQLLYTAIHHAREPIALSETIFYMWYLLENYDTNDEVKYIVDHTEMYFIPVINADGYVYNETTNPSGGGLWRKNRRSFLDGTFGVDNNRNYDYWINGDPTQSVWNTLGVSDTSSGETYPGTATFSEPETQAVRSFVESHDFKIALNAHTSGNLLLYPFGYDLNTPSPDNEYFNKISGLMASNGNLVNEIASALYAASGSSDDYMYGQTIDHDKIFAFTPEIGTSFWPAATQIIPLGKMMMFTNLTAARLVLDYASLTDTGATYLGNTAVVPLTFNLERLGLAGSGNYTVSIHPISSNIVSVGQPFVASNMAISDVLSGSIQIGIAPGTSSNDSVVFEYWIDNGQFTDKKLVNKRFGQIQNILTDNGSAINPTWTSTTWGVTTEAFVSPSTSITDSPFGNYGNVVTRTIQLTNPINLSAISGATVTFSAKWQTELRYDLVTFQISADNGPWISQCGKFTKIVAPNLLETLPAYSGEQLTWVNEEINLSDYAGQSIKMRFRLQSDNGVTYDGFYFDDFKVNLLENSVLGLTNETVSEFRIYPNPANVLLNINTSRNDYDITIFNLIGQSILSKNANDGMQRIDVGTLPSGVYIIEMRSDEFVETQKFIKN